MAVSVDLARYYAAWGSEVSTRGSRVLSGDLVGRVTGASGVPYERLRLRGSDGNLVLQGGIELAFPSGSGTLARLEDITGGGGGGESSAFQQTFTLATSVTCTHNFGAYPVVQVFDTDGNVFVPLGIEHTSADSFTVTFASSRSGTIVANYGGGSADGGGSLLSLSTDDIYEGVTNLYYSDARVDARISATIDKAYVDALNVNADTLDGVHGAGYALASHVHTWADITSGKPTTLAGYGITDAQPLDSQLTDFAALSYAGNALKVLRVNAGETGLEWAAAGTGSSDHTTLSNLAWTSSGHTGTASRIAGFSGAGAASEFTTTGSGTVVALATSPSFTTPAIGAATGTSLTLSSLTSGRVPYATTAGLLTDSANLTYSSGDLEVLGGDIVVGTGGEYLLFRQSSGSNVDRIYVENTGGSGGAGTFGGNRIRFDVNAGGVVTVSYYMDTRSFGPAAGGIVANGTSAAGWEGLYLAGSTSGYSKLVAPAVAGSATITLPAATATLAAKPSQAKVEFAEGSLQTFYSTTLVAALPAAKDSYPVESGKTYLVRGQFTISKTNGVTSHQLVFGFASPPATWQFGGWCSAYEGTSSTAATHTALAQNNTGSSTGQTITPASTTASETYRVQVEGIFTAFANGNVVPAFRWSANPGDGATTGGGTVSWPTFFQIEEIDNFGGA